jgi:hypothetical protein
MSRLMKLWSWRIRSGRTVLLALAVLGVSLYTANVAEAESSEYFSTVEGNYQLGGGMTFKVNGSLAREQRVFVFVESMQCDGTPAREDAMPSGRALTPLGGEPIGPGSYAKEYTWSVLALHELSGVCAYIGPYSPAFGESEWADNPCEQKPGSNVEPDGVVSCSIPAVSWRELDTINPPKGEVLTQEAFEARQREQARAREALEQPKPAEGVRCTVPDLHGHTLHGSRRLLSSSHCALGKVRVRRGGRGPLRVIAQTPRRSTKLLDGGHVSLTLGR